MAEEGFRRRRWEPIGQKYGRSPPPPPQYASLRNSVPVWEKKFCASVCNMPWKRLCNAQSFTHLYPDVLQWDDSAGWEAFHAAKSRYFAEMSGLPPCTPLPDPDMFIDEVDHDAILDPELFKDLHKQQPHENDDNDSKVRDSFHFANKQVLVSEWDDKGDPPSINAIRLDPDSVVITPTGWGDEDLLPKNDTNEAGAINHNKDVDSGNGAPALATGFCHMGETIGSSYVGMASFCWDQNNYFGVSANSSSVNAAVICKNSWMKYDYEGTGSSPENSWACGNMWNYCHDSKGKLVQGNLSKSGAWVYKRHNSYQRREKKYYMPKGLHGKKGDGDTPCGRHLRDLNN